MELTFRKTETADLDRVMELFGKASATMALLGIDQWQDGYPNRELIEEDIAEGRSYVVANGGKIIGTTVLLTAESRTMKRYTTESGSPTARATSPFTA